MAFLNFMKKRKEFPTDIDLDMPPEPPDIEGDDFLTEEPFDEELMPKNKAKGAKGKAPKSKKEEIPELPPLPEEEEFGELPELPPLPEEGEGLPDFKGKEDLPQLPKTGKERRGFFSFLKPKKEADYLELPKIEEEIPDVPPLPEEKDEELKGFPELPPLHEYKEIGLPEEKAFTVPPIKTPVVEKAAPKPKEEEAPKKPIKKFITINDFRNIQGEINDIKKLLNSIEGVFGELEDVKVSGDKEYAGLYNSLKDIQTKIMFVDKNLFKEKNV